MPAREITCRNCGATFFAEGRGHYTCCSTECVKAVQRERMRLYYESHKGYFARKAREFYLAHRETEKAGTIAWQKEHPDRARAINRKAKAVYRQTFKGKVAAIQDRDRRRSAGLAGRVDRAAWRAKLKSYGYRCAKCRSGVNVQMDHILPVSRGGTNEIHNLQPLCGPCNLAKRAKILPGTQMALLTADIVKATYGKAA